MSNYTQRQETIDALASMVIEQADRHGFKIEIDAIRDAVEQMAKFAGIEANETEFMLASQKVEDEARLMGKLSEKSGEMENPQERYRLSAMDEGNDHYSVLDTKTQLYWSSEGWQRPDSGWASVLTRSEAARKAYELNRKLTNYIEHEPNSALEALCQETGTTPEDWNSMDGPETGVGVERWYVHTADGREAYTVDDQGSFIIEVSVPDRKIHAPRHWVELNSCNSRI